MTAIDKILQSYRDAAVTEREKGTYFKRLGLAFFLNDPVQTEEYEAVWPWSEWAKANSWDGKDVGIDLVAKPRNEDGFAAIQAKFYAADTRIQKLHIDSFISASGKEPFRRRIVLDTIEQEWGANAEEMIRGQAIPVVRIGLTDLRLADIKNPGAFYRVTKWAFGKNGKEKDKTTIIYNANVTMQDIPLEAYDYDVNGKPAIEWVMERQVVKTDKASGIKNDANRYATETVGNPAYPLELFQRVITVSLRTMEIVRGLPKLEVI